MFSKVLHLSLRDKEMIFNCKLSKRKPSRKKKKERIFLLWGIRELIYFLRFIFTLASFGGSSMVPQMIKKLLQCRRPGFSPWVGKIPWHRKWQPCQYSCLKNRIDRGAWQAWGSMGSQIEQRDRHDWATNTFASLSFTCIFQTFSKKNKKIIYYQVIKNRGVKGRGIEVNGLNVIKPWKIH